MIKRIPKGTDPRYKYIRANVESGRISLFTDIFEVIPRSVVARDLGINNVRFNTNLKDATIFSVKDFYRLAKFCDIDEMVMMQLVYNQYASAARMKKNLPELSAAK